MYDKKENGIHALRVCEPIDDNGHVENVSIICCYFFASARCYRFYLCSAQLLTQLYSAHMFACACRKFTAIVIVILSPLKQSP